MKLCKDCKYAKRKLPFPLNWQMAKCYRPQLISATDGKITPSWANNERMFEHLCGKDAKYFEPK